MNEAIHTKAQRLLDNGYLPIPLDGKRPILSGWQEVKTVDVDHYFGNGARHNIGLRTGDNGLVVLDFDGKDGYDGFLQTMGEYADTYTVATGSGDGMHVYYIVKGPLPKSTGQIEVPGGHVEIKAVGRQVVVPPSIHPDTGALYEVVNKTKPKELSSFGAIQGWLDQFSVPKYDPQPRELDIRQAQPVNTVNSYAKSALTNAAAELASLTNVENDFQNTSCNTSAWILAHYVARGDLTESEVRSALEGAMRANGYIAHFGQKAFDATFQSGFQRGYADTSFVPKFYQQQSQPRKTMPGQRSYEPPKVVQQENGVTVIGRTRIIKRTSLFADLTARIDDDDYVPDIPPVIFPLTCLHKLGGQARVTKVGKVIGFVGASGSGKTSALETLADAYVANDVPVWMWTPEWTPDEMAERVVQRYGGPTQDELYLHDIDKYRVKKLGQTSNPDHRLKSDQRLAAAKAMRVVNAWSQDVYFMENTLMTVEEMSEVVAAAKQMFNPFPRVLIADYAQLLKANEVDEKDDTSMYNMVQRFKAMCVYYGLIGVMATQTTKEDARRNIKTGEFKGTTVINCTKNSRGIKGKVRVKSDPARLRLIDEPFPNQSFETDDYYLGSQAGRYINDDAYNLWITLNPEYYAEV